MRRIGLAVVFIVSLLPGPLAVEAQDNAQQPTKIARIGFLWTSSPRLATHAVEGFREGLRDAGYIEGQNIVIEHHAADDVLQRLPDLATEVVRRSVNVIVTQGTQAAQAAARATKTIPIVMAVGGSTQETGLIATLAKPGGNVTGLTLPPELTGKRMELLREIVPKSTRVAILIARTSTDPGEASLGLKANEAAARSLGWNSQILEVRGPGDFDKAFEAATKARAQALNVVASPILRFHRKPLVDLAAKHRLPAMYQMKEFVEAGGLISYGPRDADMFRRAAYYVDRILKGAKPADLPVEQPAKYELFINRKTAKALGLTIPQSLLLRADQVIE